MALGTLTVFSSRPLASMWMFVFHSVSMVLDTLLLSSPGPACKVQGWHVNLCFLPSLYGLVFHFNKCYWSVYWKYTHNILTIIDFFLPFGQFCSNIVSNVLMHIISSFTLIPQFNGFTSEKMQRKCSGYKWTEFPQCPHAAQYVIHFVSFRDK